MYRIHTFMRAHTFEEPNSNITIMPVIVNPRFTAARNCAVPACVSCVFARSKKRSTNTIKVKPLAEKERALLHDELRLEIFSQLIFFV